MAGEKKGTGFLGFGGRVGDALDKIKSQGKKFYWEKLGPTLGPVVVGPILLAVGYYTVTTVSDVYSSLIDYIEIFGKSAEVPVEKMSEADMRALWAELFQNRIVDVPYNKSHGSTITSEVLNDMFKGHGFDVEYNDKTSAHWEIVKDSEGKIDLKRLDFETGTGPVLHENSADAVERGEQWRWSHANAGRNISEADYARASEYFKTIGYHQYRPGEMIKNYDELLAAVKSADAGITKEMLEEILRRGGHIVDQHNTAFEIWFGPDGKPELHQLPIKDSYPRVVYVPAHTHTVQLVNADLSPIPLKAK